VPIWLVAAAGIASMTAAMERGDVEEAARQGAMAGPAVVARALAAPKRTTVLAGIAAAPGCEDRGELLVGLASLAAGPDRRVAIPAAHAAAVIAAGLARTELADDVAPEDVAEWADAWRAIAVRGDRWIEVRVDAIAVAAQLAHVTGGNGALGFDASVMFADADPAVRAAAIAWVPSPVPAEVRAPLAAVVTGDAVPKNALAAAQAMCAELVAEPSGPAIAALGAAGLAAIRRLVVEPSAPVAAVRDAARCLAADGSAESAAVIGKIKKRL
jgi:hypothetical protein